MPRVFASLAIGDLIVLSGAIVIGFAVEGDRFYAQHFGLAIFATLLTVFIHAVVVTYFAAGGRMISQAVFIGRLDRAPLERLRSGKSRAVRCVALGVTGLLPAVAGGAAAARDAGWAWFHFASALTAIMTNAAAFFHQFQAIAEQSRLMNDVLLEYERRQSTTRPA